MVLREINSFVITALSLLFLSLLSCNSDKESSEVTDEIIKDVRVGRTEEQTRLSENALLVSQGNKEISSFYRMVSLYGDKLKVSVPVSFTEMPADKVVVKYPNAGNRPNVVYTNELMSVNIAFTQIFLPTEQEG